ncbi:branched-chain amino acid aminotransferase [Fusarium beomiforme]|uniref:Branched-chain-amino-acid aminotransferase n=1 Tax=Fusarium beomiforme TaxID=44412 RepID=A0A9P5DR00_9HYPO|nr:branched-chain amino acid aminotransferase [Fusarium beomiforme]
MPAPTSAHSNGTIASSKGQLDASRLKLDLTSAVKDVPKPGSAELWEQNVATDHMVTCRWTVENGWEDPVIKAFGDLTISPLASCLHYATQCFEGMKVYRGYDNRVRLFRPDRNARRLVISAERVSLPGFDPEQLVELIKALVRVDAKRWLPEPGSFRYIRPALIGTGRQLGVQIPKEAILMITLVCWPDFSTESPPGVQSRSDLRLITSRNDTIRAWPGGFGYAKVGANYGPSFASHCEAQQAGYDQVLWLFGEDGQVTEAGASNFFAVVRDEKSSKSVLLTAPLTDRVILDGVTRRSVLDLVASRLSEELEVKETKFTIHELEAAWKDGLLMEAFVSGTAFFIKRVSTIRAGDIDINLPTITDNTSAFGPRIKGVLGEYYSARHTLGQYRSACVTATYLFPNDSQDLLDQALEYALQATIRQHAGLRYGISYETKDGIPLYKQIHIFDRNDVLEVIAGKEVAGKSCDRSDELLSRVLEKGHAELWSQNKPAWKVVIIKHMSDSFDESPSITLDIAFFAHHAVADGLSGIGFHASLMKNFEIKSLSDSPPRWPMVLDEIQNPPPAIEECIDCLSCHCTCCSSPDSCDEAVWAGNPIPPAPTVNFESRVRILTVPAGQVIEILRHCRLAKVTLTGLLHSIICTSLNKSIKEQVPGFRSVTPFSVRRHTGASDTDIVNHISYLTSYVSQNEMHNINNCPQGSADEEEHIIGLARRFTNEVATKVKEYPHGGMVTRQSKVKDTLLACQSQGGTERLYTYELSNLGAILNIYPPEGSDIKLERLVFTQCGFVAGPALGFNCGGIHMSQTPDYTTVALRLDPYNKSSEMESESLKEWIVLIPDRQGSLETRMRVRETHIKEMIQYIDSGLFQMGGATLGENTVIDGSAIIARARSEADVMTVLRTDIYARSGVWDLENIKFIPTQFKCVYRREQIDNVTMESLAVIQKDKTLTKGKVTLPPLQEHQVYVRVQYAAFNPTDRLALDVNAFGDDAVLGCDFSGKVVGVHPAGTKLKPGDRIAGFVWGGEIKGLGAYSEYTIADERLSFKIPENISLAQASSVPLAANTAWLALFSDDCLALRLDESSSKSLLIWGGSTAVGYFAIQLAKLHNIEVATTCRPRNFDKVRQAGAEHVFDYNDEEVVSKIRSALPNLQHVFDTVGNETSSATAASAISQSEGALCTVRPGKANTQDVPSHIKVTDVFVFTAFPTEHSYRGKAHWPVKMNDHNLSVKIHSQLETLLGNGSLQPPSVRLMGKLDPSTVEKAMKLNREGSISGEKLVFQGFP